MAEETAQVFAGIKLKSERNKPTGHYVALRGYHQTVMPLNTINGRACSHALANSSSTKLRRRKCGNPCWEHRISSSTIAADQDGRQDTEATATGGHRCQVIVQCLCPKVPTQRPRKSEAARAASLRGDAALLAACCPTCTGRILLYLLQ